MSLMTLRAAGEELGVTPDTLRAQIRRGRLSATKLGRDWLVDTTEVERYRRISLRTDNKRPEPGRGRFNARP